MKAPLLYIVAGEASADALGGGLMREIKKIFPTIRICGVGGDAMQREGLRSLFPYGELSIMGFAEVLPHIPRVLARLRETAIDIHNQQPDVVVTIDSPGFNFRLARALKNNAVTSHITRIHYVAPSVWAYKPQRARKTAELFNALLALLPWEPPYFEKEGLPTTYIGHPVLWQEHNGNKIGFYAKHQIAQDTKLLLLLPGSRPGEIKHQLPVFLEAAKAMPEYKVMVLAGPQVQTTIRNMVPPGTLVVDIHEKQDAFASAALALSKSGTVTLELAAAGVPTVVAHRVSAFSAWLLRRMVLVPYVSLVNLAAKKEIIPELLQERCNVSTITQTLQALASPQATQQQRDEYKAAIAMLRGATQTHPDTAAAQAVARLIQK